jgi:hypothetical protein
LTVRYRVYDQKTGADITKETNCFVKLGSNWVKLDSRVSDALRSGSRHQFKFGHMGYFPRTYDLTTDPEQHLLSLAVFLIPRPGSLKILSDHDGTMLLLDDLRYYISGAENGSVQQIPKSTTKPLVLVLSPGMYRLAASRSSASAETVTVLIDSGRTTEVRLSFDADSKSLELHQSR